MISATGTVPGLGALEEMNHLALPRVIEVLRHLLPENPRVDTQLHLSAEGGKEGDKNDVGLAGIEHSLRERRARSTCGSGRSHEISQDPVLGAVLFDQRAFSVRWETGSMSGRFGRTGSVIRVVGDPGIVGQRPVLFEEAVIEGSGELCEVH